MPAVDVTDLAGKSIKLESLKKQWLLIVVAPSSCDEVCDKNLFMQRQLRDMLGRERNRVDKIWLVTDNGPIKPELIKAGGPNLQIYRMAAHDLDAWLKPSEGHTLSQQTFLVDPMGNWMMRFPANPDPYKIKKDLSKMLTATSSWDNEGR